jgi:hypothetical protein
MGSAPTVTTVAPPGYETSTTTIDSANRISHHPIKHEPTHQETQFGECLDPAAEIAKMLSYQQNSRFIIIIFIYIF